MIEIISIFFQIFFIFILNILPKKYFFSKAKYEEDIQIYSNIIIIFLLLIFSYFNVPLIFILYFLIIIFLLNFSNMMINKTYNLIYSNNNWLVFLIVLFLSVNLSVDLGLGWDAQNYWVIRYLNFKKELGIENLSSLARPDYPYLGSYIWAVFSETNLLKHEYFGRIYYIYIFCLSLNRLVNLSEFKTIEKSLLYLSLIFLIFNLNLINGYQEIIIFSYLIILSIYSMYHLKKKFNIIDFCLIGLTCFILFWIKNEAMIYALIIIFTLFLFSEKKKTYLFLTAVVIISARYLIYKYLGLETELQSGNYDQLKIHDLLQFIDLDRFYLIFKYFIIAHLKHPVSIIIILSALILVKRKLYKDKINGFFLSLFFLNYIFIFTAYFISTFPLEFHLSTSIDRMLFQSLGSTLIILFLLLRNLKKT
jgi:hypothetical protein